MEKRFFIMLLIVVVISCSPTQEGTGTTANPVNTGNENSPLGINLDAIMSWTTQCFFLDAFKQSRYWIPQLIDDWSVWDSGEPIDTDEYGWVKSLSDNQRVSTIIMDSHGKYPSGTYYCDYEGEGLIEFSWDASVISRLSNRIKINVTPSTSGILLTITSNNSNNYIRNISIVHEDYIDNYQEQIYFPDYISKLEKFSLIRFMQMQQVNSSSMTNTNWSARITTNYASQSQYGGVALEYMIELANRVHADAWFCVPHGASDDYVRNMARLIDNLLDDDLNIYIEYSNEVWNTIYPQYSYARDKGLGLGLDSNEFTAAMLYYSKRAVEIFDIFEEEIGLNRLVRVLAAQSANSWTGTTIMDYQDAYLSTDAMAIAPYFSWWTGEVNNVATLSVEQILDACAKNITNVMGDVSYYSNYCYQRDLDLIAYEGGQHLVADGGWNADMNVVNNFYTANRSPRMKDLYLIYLNMWKNGGGKVFALYTFMEKYGVFGTFGILENMEISREDSPKYDAAMEFIENNDRWW